MIDLGEHRFRKAEESDIDAMVAYRNEPEVTATVGGFGTGFSRRDAEAWIEHHRRAPDRVVWVLARKRDDRCVGHGGFYQVDHRRGKAELGLAIAASEQGRGLGGRCLAHLVDYGFRQLRLHRLETFNLALNARIVTIKENLGFTLEGVMRDHQFKDGRYLDTMVMAILSHEWQGIPEKYR